MTVPEMCHTCGARFDAEIKMNAVNVITCPTCGETLRRIYYIDGQEYKV